MNSRFAISHLWLGRSLTTKPWLWIGGTVAVAGMVTALILQRPFARPQLFYAPLQHAAEINQLAAYSPSNSAPIENKAAAGTATEISSPPQTLAPLSDTAATNRKVIETASMVIRLPHPVAVVNQINQLVIRDGGFIASLQEQTVNSTTVYVTVRVPEADFTGFLHETRGFGKVLNFSQTGQDVTQQYTNLQQLLAERKQEATAYTRLYHKAQTMKDMIAIQQSLTQVNTQVSQLESQIHGLDKAVAYATINLTLTEPAANFQARQPWPIVRALQRPWNALTSSITGLITIFAWLVPWVALFAAVSGGLRFWLRWRRRKQS